MRKASMLMGLSVAAGLAGTIVTPPVHAGQVFIQATEQGQGRLRSSGGDCFVIAPDHVVMDEVDIEVVDSKRGRGFGWYAKSFPQDVGIVQLDKKKGLDCSDPWPDGAGLRVWLEKAHDVTVVQIHSGGIMKRLQVSISGSDSERITVKMLDPDAHFSKGMSGSTLMIDGEVAGMVMLAEDGGRTAGALRQDYLSSIIRSYFENELKRYDTTVAVETVDQPYMVVKNANIRFGPGTESKRIGFAKAGRIVTVLGKVKRKDWFHIDVGDGTIGYVFGPLLEPIAPIGRSAKRQSQAKTTTLGKSRAPSPPQMGTKVEERRIFKVQPFLYRRREVPQLTAQVRQRLSSLGNSAVVAANAEHVKYDYLVSGQILRAERIGTRPNPKYESAQSAKRLLGKLGIPTSGASKHSPLITRYEAEVTIDLQDRHTGFVTTEISHVFYEDDSGSVNQKQAVSVAVRHALGIALNKALARIAR